ncbi:uncharacterized protein LOC124796210 [Schistocerca piceifrons]|uniref:uncharacterized protein LOC124796210 n=1 Tax=Schistocerca piceifrons TaxID=274613 RepID=UPI001F5E57E8|nr:uncharacterized protein LOC124796210 [Schistocerca piceifrons]
MYICILKWKKYNVVIGGDINSSFDVLQDRKTVTELKNVLRQFNLYYVNCKPTRGSSCLDNIFTNIKRTCMSTDVISFPFSDHDAVYLSLNNVTSDCTKPESKTVITRPVSRERVGRFRHALTYFSWDTCFIRLQHCSADIVFTKFFSVFLNVFENNIPLKKCTVNISSNYKKRKTKEWCTPQLGQLKNTVMLYSSLYKTSKSELYKDLYAKAKCKYRKAINEAKKLHNIVNIEKSNNKCKKAWSVINSILHTKHTEEIAITPEEFNKYCIQSIEEISSSIIKPPENALSIMDSCFEKLPQSTFTFTEVSPNNILKIVKNVKPSVSVDYYDMSCNLLKDVIDCFFSKISEKIMYEQVSAYLGKLTIISDKQFGFRKGKSTTDAMDSLVKLVLDVFEARDYAQATLCDLSRAFDCVEHDTVLNKLVYYGFDDNSINMFRSFLENSQQVVCIGREKSNLVNVSATFVNSELLHQHSVMQTSELTIDTSNCCSLFVMHCIVWWKIEKH